MQTIETHPSPGRAALALLLILPAPTIGVIFALFLVPGTALGAAVQLTAKIWIFAFPVAWVLFVERGKPRLPKLKWPGMPAGIISGLAILAIIIGAWELFAKNMVDLTTFQTKMSEVGLDTPLKFIAFAAAITAFNALLEEYVWRWFVYTKCFEALNRFAGKFAVPGAIILAGLFFTLHHTIALHLYFDWKINALASFGVFSGGVIWSILYLKTNNLYAAYISHIMANIAMFYVAYQVAFG